MSHDDEVLQQLLTTADTDRVEPSPQFMERMLALTPEATDSSTRVPATAGSTPPSPAKSRVTRRTLLATALVATVAAVVGTVLLWHPSPTWAQVAEAVASKPWIHMHAKDPQGNTRDLWLSLPRDIAALKSPSLIRHDDHRRGARLEFDPTTKKLLRLPIEDKESFESMTTFFRAIFRGDSQLGERLAEDQILEQKQRTVTDAGQTWLEHDLTMQRGDKTALCTVRVNPEQRLPVWLRLKAGEMQVQYDFDFPATGPMNIYDLDVSRDIAVEDRMPPADLAKIQRSLQSSQRDFDNYMAIAMRGNRKRGGPQSPERILWRKGDRWRVELIMPVALKDTPPMEGDVAGWWRKQIRQIEGLPVLVCDGRKVYRSEFRGTTVSAWKTERVLRSGEGRAAARSFGDAGENVLEYVAYPTLIASSMSTISLDPKGTGGPEKSLLLEVNLTGGDDRAYRKMRYWLDPERQNVVLKSELSGCPAVDRDPQSVPSQKMYAHEYGEFRQSPRGVWYPTEVVWKNGLTPVSPDKSQPAEPQDLVRSYVLDFEADLPDELFTTTMRKKE